MGWRWDGAEWSALYTDAQRAEIEACADFAMDLVEPAYDTVSGVWAVPDSVLHGLAALADDEGRVRDLRPALVRQDGRGVYLVMLDAEGQRRLNERAAWLWREHDGQ